MSWLKGQRLTTSFTDAFGSSCFDDCASPSLIQSRAGRGVLEGTQIRHPDVDIQMCSQGKRGDAERTEESPVRADAVQSGCRG